jgi:hypothetical protein
MLALNLGMIYSLFDHKDGRALNISDRDHKARATGLQRDYASFKVARQKKEPCNTRLVS